MGGDENKKKYIKYLEMKKKIIKIMKKIIRRKNFEVENIK